MSKKERRSVPVLRFKGFTDDWEQRKFNELGKLYYGKSAPKWSVVEKGGTPCIRYGELYTKYSSKIDNVYSHTSIDKSKLKFSTGNELLIPRVGEEPLDFAKHTSWLSIPNVAIGEMITVLKTKENPLFLANYLRAKYVFKFARLVEGGNVSNLYFERYEDTNILIPSKNEQQNISKLILKIDKLITLQQQKNADIINLKKAILDKIFSNSNIQKWRDIRLNKVLSIPVDEPKEVTNIDDIISVKLNTQGISKIPNRSTLKLGSTKYYVRHGGQFIFGKQNFFNGSMAIIPSKYDGKVSSKDVPSLNINKDMVMPYFLWLYLSRPSFYKKTERWATGTGSKRLHIKDLLSLKIYIPNKNEQLRICKLMQSLDTQILKSQKHLKELQSIKKFLLQNMFI